MTHKQKIIFIILGVMTALLALEISLRLAGFIYKHYRINNHERKAEVKDEFIKILCLGDSFTFGEGAPKGYSYPEQLQKILDNISNKKYIVYNAGIGGQNSSQILKNLENNIQRYKPDVILLMAGINNNNNFSDSNYFLFKDSSIKTYLFRVDAFFYNLKSYKLLRSAIVTVCSKNSKKIKSNNSYSQLIINKEGIKNVSDELKKDAEEHLKAAKSYESQLSINYAINECNKAREINPYDYNLYYLLGFIYLHRVQNLEEKIRLKLAIENFKKAVYLNPSNELVHENLFNAYYRIGERKKAEEELDIWHTLDPRNETVNALLVHGLPEYRDMDVFRMTLAYDLNNIINLLNSKNIKLVLMNYPGSWVNDDLKEIAIRNKTAFIDNQAVFKQKELMPGYVREYYFAEDGHCNANGYKVIAQNVYNTCIELKAVSQ